MYLNCYEPVVYKHNVVVWRYNVLRTDLGNLIVSGMASLAARSLGRLAANRSFFFLCDMQEKFKSNIKYFPEIATVAQRLVGTKILEYTAT